MKRKVKVDFHYSFIGDNGKGGLLAIVDLNKGGMSVTNGVELVLDQIKRECPDQYPPFIAIYKDSDGRIDEIVLDDKGNFDKIRIMQKHKWIDALASARERKFKIMISKLRSEMDNDLEQMIIETLEK